MNPLQLLGRADSINVRKVLWTLDELGLPYAREDWGAGFRSCQEPAFLALNPNAMVPVLRDGDFTLWESNSICRYLAARYGAGHLLPSEPQARAQMEQWMDWQAGDLNTAWRVAFMALVRGQTQRAEAVAASVALWNQRMQVLDAQLARSSAHVLGPEFTLADVVLGLACVRWQRAPNAHAELPAVAAYLERLRERPAFMRHGDNGMP